MSLSFAIIGTGALGGYYGARLHHAGFETHFLLHRDYKHVTQFGLKVESVEGDFSIAKPSVFADVEALPLCDVICICTKTTANDQFRKALASKLKPNGCILTLQNGLGVEEDLASWYPHTPIFGGLCFLCSNKLGPGYIKHLDYGAIHFAGLPSNPPTSSVLLAQIQQCFQKAGIHTGLLPDIAVARWQKLVWNIPFNGLCVVLQCNTEQLLQNPASAELVRALMNEVADAAEACGTPIAPGFVDKMLIDTLKMKPYLPSMRLDFDRHQAMEIDAIYSQPIQRAATHGFSMKLTQMLRDQLIFLQARN